MKKRVAEPAGGVGVEVEEIILQPERPLAFIVRGVLTPEQRDWLYRRAMHQEFRLDLGLTRRWGVGAVMCAPDWAASMAARKNAPRGRRLALPL